MEFLEADSNYFHLNNAAAAVIIIINHLLWYIVYFAEECRSEIFRESTRLLFCTDDEIDSIVKWIF